MNSDTKIWEMIKVFYLFIYFMKMIKVYVLNKSDVVG